jgi:hypothetical protein
MSYVSDVVLYVDSVADEMVAIPATGLKDVTEHAGGTKVMGGEILAGGLNFFEEEKFIEWFGSVDWINPAVLIIRTEQNPVKVFLHRGKE